MLKKLDIINALYPMPMTIIGANVDNKPNFIAIAHVGIITMDKVSLSMAKTHFTNRGIKENKTFRVNVPSEDMIVETDYVGLVSGKQTDKSDVFEVIYGELKTAPLIVQAPICMECRLIDSLDYATHDIFIGHIEGIYAQNNVLTNGKIDLQKAKPILFDMFEKRYWTIGKPIADAWKIGKEKIDQLH